MGCTSWITLHPAATTSAKSDMRPRDLNFRAAVTYAIIPEELCNQDTLKAIDYKKKNFSSGADAEIELHCQF